MQPEMSLRLCTGDLSALHTSSSHECRPVTMATVHQTLPSVGDVQQHAWPLPTSCDYKNISKYCQIYPVVKNYFRDKKAESQTCSCECVCVYLFSLNLG